MGLSPYNPYICAVQCCKYDSYFVVFANMTVILWFKLKKDGKKSKMRGSHLWIPNNSH